MDWKRNNKIALRNFSENCDFHDVVKLLLVRMLRRIHSDSKKYPIYTEHNPLKPNEDYPDIWMKVGKDIYVWEIQDKLSESWLQKQQEKFEEVNLIVVPLSNLDQKNLETLKKQLEDFVL